MNILEIPVIARMRCNHALEHATIHVLTHRNPYRRLVGRTGLRGFDLYGEVETEEVASAALEALARLRAGERHLAIHPRCGTSLATAGVLAGLASFVALSGRKRSRLAQLPQALLAATAAVIVAQPLGLALQEYITTSAGLEGVSIEGVTRQVRGNVVVHEVIVKSR